MSDQVSGDQLRRIKEFVDGINELLVDTNMLVYCGTFGLKESQCMFDLTWLSDDQVWGVRFSE
jgi:hypothetical protein